MAKKQSSLKRKHSFSGSQVLLFVLAFAAVGAVAVWQSLAAPRGGGGGSGGSLSLTMVVDANSDGGPNWNDDVSFNVSTTATDKPWVKLNCYQNGQWVSTNTAGFFPAYPWGPNFTLASGGWTSGAGDCTATLYMVTSNGRTKNLATLSFHVNA